MVTVSLNGIDKSQDNLIFSVYPMEFIEHINPTRGIINGGTSVSIIGGNFIYSAGLSCSFGGTTVPASYVSETEITCFAPSRVSTGMVNVSVTNNGVDFTSETFDFDYVNLPTVSSIIPRSGPIGVPISIEVTGSGFIEESTWCRVGKGEPIVANVVSVSKLKCVLMLNDVGTETVSVTSNLQNYNGQTILFELIKPPRIVRVSPTMVSSDVVSNLPVIIHGEGFPSTADLSCMFDDTPAQATYISSASVSCFPPLLGPGVVQLKLLATDSNLTTKSLDFSYYVPIRVIRAKPAFGSLYGGTYVYVHGLNFQPTSAIRCRFDAIDVPSQYLNTSCIACISPAQENIGSVSLEVSLNGMDYK